MGKGKKAMLEVSKMKMTPALSAEHQREWDEPDGSVNLMTPNVITTRVVRISTSRYAKEVSSHQ